MGRKLKRRASSLGPKVCVYSPHGCSRSRTSKWCVVLRRPGMTTVHVADTAPKEPVAAQPTAPERVARDLARQSARNLDAMTARAPKSAGKALWCACILACFRITCLHIFTRSAVLLRAMPCVSNQSSPSPQSARRRPILARLPTLVIVAIKGTASRRSMHLAGRVLRVMAAVLLCQPARQQATYSSIVM